MIKKARVFFQWWKQQKKQSKFDTKKWMLSLIDWLETLIDIRFKGYNHSIKNKEMLLIRQNCLVCCLCLELVIGLWEKNFSVFNFKFAAVFFDFYWEKFFIFSSPPINQFWNRFLIVFNFLNFQTISIVSNKSQSNLWLNRMNFQIKLKSNQRKRKNAVIIWKKIWLTWLIALHLHQWDTFQSIN